MFTTVMGTTLSESMSVFINDKTSQLFNHYPTIESAKAHVIYHQHYEEFEFEITLFIDKKEFFVKSKDSDFHQACEHAVKAMQHKLEKEKTMHNMKHHNKNAFHDTSVEEEL